MDGSLESSVPTPATPVHVKIRVERQALPGNVDLIRPAGRRYV